jgi:hypothetical protein
VEGELEAFEVFLRGVSGGSVDLKDQGEGHES